MKKEWFATWFDSPFYHILYKYRDGQEASVFMNQLNETLALPESAEVLDLACGKGRHALTLHQLGYRVTGADLSCKSIQEASRCAREGLEFIVHDMRDVIPGKQFQAVFNLFTSFGYFDDRSGNLQVLSAVHTMLEEEGLLVLDFMNAEKVISNLIADEKKEIDGITFHIQRHYDGQHIRKEIRFWGNDEEHFFTERVQALTPQDFYALMDESGFRVLNTYGDFALSPFDSRSSDRFIIIAQKKTCKQF
ncbi:MAG: hypothetical protein A3D92_14725 [Bacteroidetes bacterium RIFCSPHIGHO2_02_FULL_44_7]|nr:MAG: hypothetical protein A3D92_14725 [Bacteroidetes bacterium RIFCSPHIGHO2_02_FULL_44_7]